MVSEMLFIFISVFPILRKSEHFKIIVVTNEYRKSSRWVLQWGKGKDQLFRIIRKEHLHWQSPGKDKQLAKVQTEEGGLSNRLLVL